MKIISDFDPLSAATAASFLAEGKVVAIPTDTVYGLAVNAFDEKAVNRLYQLKNRDISKPIAVFVPGIARAHEIVVFSGLAEKIISKYSNESITLVLPQKKDRNSKLSPALNGNDRFLGIRIVKNDFIDRLFLEIAKYGNFLLAVTSANISGKQDAINANEVANYFANDLELVIDNGKNEKKSPSTVIKVVDNDYLIIRSGKIDELAIKSLL